MRAQRSGPWSRQLRQSVDESLTLALEQTIRQRPGTTRAPALPWRPGDVTYLAPGRGAWPNGLPRPASMRALCRVKPAWNCTAAGLWDGTLVLTLPSR